MSKLVAILFNPGVKGYIIWGAIMGFFAYVAIRFPWWLFNVPDDGQRGPLLRPVELVVTVLLAIVISVLVLGLLARSKSRRVLSIGYPLAALLLPFILFAPIIFYSYHSSTYITYNYDLGTSDWSIPFVIWLFVSLLPQLCLLPFGLISAVVFYVKTKREENAGEQENSFG
jgi:hypothetical protein